MNDFQKMLDELNIDVDDLNKYIESKDFENLAGPVVNDNNKKVVKYLYEGITNIFFDTKLTQLPGQHQSRHIYCYAREIKKFGEGMISTQNLSPPLLFQTV